MQKPAITKGLLISFQHFDKLYMVEINQQTKGDKNTMLSEQHDIYNTYIRKIRQILNQIIGRLP